MGRNTLSRIVSTLLLVAVLLTIGARPVKADELVSDPLENVLAEPTYKSACANWKPVQYQCAVLAAKNSRANFVTDFRGGLHTAYVSEVLGHCPLSPGKAELIQYLPEGIQVLFIAGETPDYRTAPRPDIHQRLRKGYLPIVETTWEDPSGNFRYEQDYFVRLIGNKLEVEKGDENSAGFVRLRVTNLTDSPQQAYIRLCINGSNNGQPRRASAPEYLSSLSFKGDRLLNAKGDLRVLFTAPEGAKVEPHIRKTVPQILEWRGDKNKPVKGKWLPNKPFNRYFESKADEDFSIVKAFDPLIRTYWISKETGPIQGDIGFGLEFPEDRYLKQFRILFDGGRVPAIDGYSFEYFNGADWLAIPHTLNDKKTEELKDHPEIQQSIGDQWIFNFDPLKMRGIRFLINKIPEGKSRPAASDVHYIYSLNHNPADGSGKWFETASDYESNYILFNFPVAARSCEEITLSVPHISAGKQETAWIEGRKFEKELATVDAYWQSIVDGSARFEFPERVVQEVWNANIHHFFTATEKDPTNGLIITMTNVGWYEAIWPSLSATEILALDWRGYHDDAAEFLEPFIKWQGTIEPPGQYESREGFYAAADEYTWMRWVSNHGWILWTMSEHYLLSGDQKWLDHALPSILAACDWIQRERNRNKVDNEDGTRPPHWGLLPPGVTGDGAPSVYSFSGEASVWQGLNTSAMVLRQIGHPRAKELTEAAKEYKQCIETAMRWGAANAPGNPYKLKSGRTIPFVPMDTYNKWRINIGNPDTPWTRHPWYLDLGPMHAIDFGAIDPESNLATWMIQTAEDYWIKHLITIDMPFYAPQRAVYYGKDDINRFLGVYYNLLAEGMDRQIYAQVEGHHGVQNLPWADGEHTRFVRMMLIQEDDNLLTLARAIPRAWLIQAQRVAVKDAPTHFGNISFTIESDVLNNRITAHVTPPQRISVPVRLRLRHPQSKPIQSVTIAGQAHTDFGTEWIYLPEGKSQLDIVATY